MNGHAPVVFHIGAEPIVMCEHACMNTTVSTYCKAQMTTCDIWKCWQYVCNHISSFDVSTLLRFSSFETPSKERSILRSAFLFIRQLLNTSVTRTFLFRFQTIGWVFSLLSVSKYTYLKPLVEISGTKNINHETSFISLSTPCQCTNNWSESEFIKQLISHLISLLNINSNK